MKVKASTNIVDRSSDVFLDLDSTRVFLASYEVSFISQFNSVL